MEEFIRQISNYLNYNLYLELFFFLLGTILIAFIFYAEYKIKAFFQKIPYFEYIQTAIEISLLLGLYFLFSNTEQYGVKIFPIVAKYFVLFLLVYDVIKAIFKLLNITHKALLFIILIFTFLNVSIAFVMEFAREFSIPISNNYDLEILFKSLALILISILVYLLSIRSTKYIPQRLSFISKFIQRFHIVFNIAVLGLGYLWITNIINPSIKHFIVSVILLVLLFAYAFFIYYINEISKHPIVQEHFPNLKTRLTTLVSIIFLVIFYNLINDALELEIDKWLKNIYIVKTDVLTVSLFSILESILLFTFLLNLILMSRSLLRYWKFKQTGESVPTPAEAIIYNLGILIAAIFALSVLGITWKVLLPLIGALGIGAGFGLQNIINNYISGFILIFNKKIEVGDIVEIPGNAGSFTGTEGDVIFGMVMDISVINTLIETIDGVEVAIPNSKFISDNIINYTFSNSRVRMRIPFKVAYNTDHKKVEEILLKVAEECRPPILHTPEKPQVWFNSIKDYYDEYVLLFWINAYNWRKIQKLKSDIYKRVWEEFRKEGIEVPVINIEIKSSHDSIKNLFN